MVNTHQKRSRNKRNKPDPKKKEVIKKEVLDQGTPELSKKFQVRPELINRRNQVHLRVTDQTIFDRLLLEDKITLDQHNAADQFAVLVHKAGFIGLKAPRYEYTVPSGDPQMITQKQADLRVTVWKMIAEINKRHAGAGTALMDAVIMDHADEGLLIKALGALMQSVFF